MKKLPILSSALVFVFFASIAYAESPGDTAGTTTYDYQVGVTPGNRVALDKTGGAFMVWAGSSPFFDIKYNYFDPEGNRQSEDGIAVANGTSPQIAVDSLNRPAIAFDAGEDIAFWNQLHGQNDPNYSYASYRPMLSIDSRDNIHIFALSRLESSAPPQYFRSSDGGVNWSNADIYLEYIAPTTPRVVVSSPVSDKVAVVFPFPLAQEPTEMFDIKYIQSSNGVIWDWENGRVNVTDYSGPLYAGRDIDAVYDFNDNLHLTWIARNADGITVSDTTFLFHFIVGGEINEIVRYEIAWPGGQCDLGIGNHPLCRLSMGVSQATGILAVIYNKFNPGDCSASGFANGEIYCQYSQDNGSIWSLPINVTSSPAPNCVVGNCDSDIGPSLAEKIDNSLHIFYVNDKDAGSVAYSEGNITNNPLLYLRLPVATLGIDDKTPIPDDIFLSQNYPNPFNAQTTISFTLSRDTEINLSIFDITGTRVTTIYKGVLNAGIHHFNWDGSNQSSGAYLVKLATPSGSSTGRMILIK